MEKQQNKQSILQKRLRYIDSVDNDNLEQHKYVCITTCQPDTESNSNANPKTSTKQQAIENAQLNIATCPTYLDITLYETRTTSVLLLDWQCHTAW